MARANTPTPAAIGTAHHVTRPLAAASRLAVSTKTASSSATARTPAALNPGLVEPTSFVAPEGWVAPVALARLLLSLARIGVSARREEPVEDGISATGGAWGALDIGADGWARLTTTSGAAGRVSETE